jgi:hypothetical protein
MDELMAVFEELATDRARRFTARIPPRRLGA